MTTPLPKSMLQIEGDPTAWGLRDVGPGDPDWDSTPVALAVITPLVATLVLSPVRVGSFALLPPSADPARGEQPTAPFVYLPSVTGVSSGYALAAGNDNLATLEQDILTAMRESTYLPLEISVAGGTGTLVVNGGVLPFVVIGG
jgi:hypothetical protein